MLDNVWNKGDKCEAKEGRKRWEVKVLMGDPGEGSGSEADQLSAEAQTWGEVQQVASGSNGKGGAHLLIAARWFAPICLIVKDKNLGKREYHMCYSYDHATTTRHLHMHPAARVMASFQLVVGATGREAELQQKPWEVSHSLRQFGIRN